MIERLKSIKNKLFDGDFYKKSGIAIIGLWLSSIVMPAVITESPLVAGARGEVVSGWLILMAGWLGPLMWQFGWFANIVLPVAMVCAMNRALAWKACFILAALTLILGINSLFWSNFPDDNNSGPIVEYLVGYYCWVTAVFAGGVWLVFRTLELQKNWDDWAEKL